MPWSECRIKPAQYAFTAEGLTSDLLSARGSLITPLLSEHSYLRLSGAHSESHGNSGAATMARWPASRPYADDGAVSPPQARPGCLAVQRNGRFLLAFFDDAESAATCLDIALPKRGATPANLSNGGCGPAGSPIRRRSERLPRRHRRANRKPGEAQGARLEGAGRASDHPAGTPCTLTEVNSHRFGQRNLALRGRSRWRRRRSPPPNRRTASRRRRRSAAGEWLACRRPSSSPPRKCRHRHPAARWVRQPVR